MGIKTTILEQIAKSRKNAIDLANDNLDRALQNSQFKEAYLQLKQLDFDIAKLQFEGKNTKILDEKREICFNDCKQILHNINMSFDDFVPHFECKICNDTGYNQDKLCACYYAKLNKLTSNNIGIKINKEHSFDNCNFEIFENKDEYKKTYKMMEDWCDKFDTTKYKNLILCGKSGVGKTFVAECICNKMMGKNRSVSFYSSFALNNLFLKYHTTFDQTKASLMDGILSCDLLVIDDLGSEPMLRNVTIEYLFVLLNERLTNNKSTIVTTNLSLNQILDKYGERIFSRLCNKASSLLINFNNKDLRLKK